jgi:type IX secretion system PorP/SprF family membrane protein
MKHWLTYTLLFLLLTGKLLGQQDAQYTQYMFNPLNVNPAYAGNKAILSAALIHRAQWVGIEGAPRTQHLAVHSPLKDKNMGVGFQLLNDKIGPKNTFGVLGTYAYRVRPSKISRGKVGFGLRMGYYRYTFDWNKIDYKDQSDALVASTVQNYSYLNFDFGVYYNTRFTYAGLSIYHLNNPKIGIADGYERVDGKPSAILNHFSLIGGKIIEINDRTVFRPSMLVKVAPRSPIVADINASFLLDNVIWLGLGYRTSNALAAIVEYEINEQFKIGYSYDYSLSGLSNQHSGSHELFLGYNFNVFKSRMRSPRYYF